MEEAAAPAPLVEVNTGTDTLIMTGDFATFSPALMFEYWTKPELLTQWWPPVAEVEPRNGGAYYLYWPVPDWHMHGSFTNFEPGRSVAFTWKWDHEPDTPTRTVEVTLHDRSEGGCRITIIHGPYDQSERDQQDRVSHVDGWQYYCGRLATLVTG